MDELGIIQAQIAQNNAWSAEQVQKQMDFQERMSNTAHQREIADLKAAGLNPVLSARLGGASSPSGASAVSDPSATSAMASMLSKLLEIDSDNAKANLVRAYSGYGYYNNNSASDLTNKDVNGLLQGLGMGLPNSAIYALDKIQQAAADWLKNHGVSKDSDLYKYTSGDWSVKDSLRVINNAIKDVVDDAKTLVSNFGSNSNGSLFTNSNGSIFSEKNIKNAVNNTKVAIANAVNTVKSVFSNTASNRSNKSSIAKSASKTGKK